MHDGAGLRAVAKCPSCGVENIPSAERCRLCGKEMGQRPQQTDTTRCPHCGTVNPGDEMTCSVCRRLLSTKVIAPRERYERDVVHYDKPEIVKKPRTRMPIIGGAILLVMGLGSLGWLLLATLMSAFAIPEHMEELSGFLLLAWLMVAVMVLGAVVSFKRVWWPVAELGAVIAFILTLAWYDSPVCLLFPALAFVSMLLIFLSRAEFS